MIAPREISRTQHDSRDIEWEIRKLCRSVEACKVTQHDSEILNGKGKSERLHEAQGREATACANTAGKIVNVTVEPVTLEKNPADEFQVIKLH